MEAQTSSIPDIRKLLTYLCDRDGSVEMAAIEDSDDEELEKGFHHARILEVTENSILLERPLSRNVPIRIQAGQPLFCVALVSGQRFSFECTATGGQVFQLNEKTKVPAIRTTWPGEVRQGQRRDYYRVPMPLEYRVPVWLTPVEESNLPSMVAAEWSNQCLLRGECPDSQKMGIFLPQLGSPTIECEMRDLSAEGIGLLVPIIMARHLKAHEYFRIWMHMPMLGPVIFTVKQVYFVKRTSRMVQAGFQIVSSHHEARRKALTKMIHEVSGEIQREILRKRSGNE